MALNSFGIDLGTSNIKIYNRSKDNYYMEKNMIAVESRDRIFAYGDSAYEMYEKSPEHIKVTFPLDHGVIADIDHMQSLLHYYISDLGNGVIKPAEYYIAVPTDVTEVEKRAFHELIKDANIKAKKIFMVEKATAGALGMDIDVKNSQGVCLIDVGFDSTEVSILSMGGIVSSRLLKIGGRQFDASIQAAVRQEYNLLIGSKTAEKIKYSIGEMTAQNKDALVYGRDIVSGLPKERAIQKDLVLNCLQEHFALLVDTVKQTLDHTPPELGADIYRSGIYLTGGASQIALLGDMLRASTELKVNRAVEPMASVVKGLEVMIRNDKYKSLAYTIEGVGH